MPVSAAVPDDHPLMIAWMAHKSSGEYANSRQWAKDPEHLDGSLWALFAAGWTTATERAASLHESIRPSCDHEPNIGAGAMGAVIPYRDAIRATS